MPGSVTVTVTQAPPPPVITQQPPHSLTVTAGESANFSVAVAGSTPLTYQWIKNGATIPGATLSTYTITAVQPSDSGTYTCLVTNAVGGKVISNASSLTVAPPPGEGEGEGKSPLYCPFGCYNASDGTCGCFHTPPSTDSFGCFNQLVSKTTEATGCFNQLVNTTKDEDARGASSGGDMASLMLTGILMLTIKRKRKGGGQ